MGDPSDLPPGNHFIASVPGAYDPPVPSSNNPPVPSSNKKALSDRESMLYTIGVGAFTALLSAGPGIYDNHPSIGGGFTIVGAVGLIGLGLFLIWYRVKIIHALIAALVVISIVLGYVIWTKPKEVIVHDPPTAEDIAKATAPIIAERDAAIKARDDAMKERNAARPDITPPPGQQVTPLTSQPKWSDQEIATRLDLWHAVQKGMNGFINAYNSTDIELSQWEDTLRVNKKDFAVTFANGCRKQISDASEVFQKLRRDYPNFEDISATIDQPYLGPLLDSIDKLVIAVQALPEPLPPNYQTTIRPSVGEVRRQMQNFLDWISNVKTTAGGKLNQLEIMSHK